MVLAIARDIGNEAEVVGGDGGVLELLEVSGAPNEHMVVPRWQGGGDKPSNGLSVDQLAIGPLSRLLCSSETLDSGRIAHV